MRRSGGRSKLNILIHVFQLCLPFQISLTDGMPSKICSDCWDQCAKWSLFRQQFRKNDATLRGLLMFSNAAAKTEGVRPLDVAMDNDLIFADDDEANEANEVVEQLLAVGDLLIDSEIAEDPTPLTRPDGGTPEAKVATVKDTQSTKKEFTKPASLTCSHCDKKFRKLAMLEAHVRVHEGKKPFVCPTCNMEFNGRLAMRNHMFTHNDGGYPCEDCNRTFKYPQLVKEHRQRMHSDQKKAFPCTVCSNEFSRAQTLQVHMLTHTDEKPVECDICHAHFKSEGYMKIHRVRHSDVRKFECPEVGCSKSFFTRSEYNFHRKDRHSNDKPNKCAECGKGFVKKSQLQCHLRTHSGGHLKCSNCPRSFKTAPKLNEHKKDCLQPGKAFQCEHCDRVFRSKHSLQIHGKKHKEIVKN